VLQRRAIPARDKDGRNPVERAQPVWSHDLDGDGQDEILFFEKDRLVATRDGIEQLLWRSSLSLREGYGPDEVLFWHNDRPVATRAEPVRSLPRTDADRRHRQSVVRRRRIRPGGTLRLERLVRDGPAAGGLDGDARSAGASALGGVPPTGGRTERGPSYKIVR